MSDECLALIVFFAIYPGYSLFLTSSAMVIRVEFYGIVRQRADTATIHVEEDGSSLTLGELLQQIVTQIPELAQDCIANDQLQAGYVANINGQEFVSDPRRRIESGQTVLIMSADAGG